MRTITALFALVLPLSSGWADEKPEPASTTYLKALLATADLLSKVTDEASATEAKPKLDDLHSTARAARKRFFEEMADPRVPEHTLAGALERMSKVIGDLNDKITAEFDRIAANHKPAYKVLRGTKLFGELEKKYEEKAELRAMALSAAVMAYSARKGIPPKNPNDLAALLDQGQKGLTDPWGFPYQMESRTDTEGRTRTFVWTVSPYSGKKLGTPPPDEPKK